MNSKQRDVIFQRWRGEIQRESRDVDALEQMLRRAMMDSDVREDTALQSLIRAEVQGRRVELAEQSRTAGSAAGARKTMSGRATPASEPSAPVSPEQVRDDFNRLVRLMATSLEQGNETETRSVFGRMRSLQQQHPEVIPPAAIAEYEQQTRVLQRHIKELSDEIADVGNRAVASARKGKEEELGLCMRRLVAIHAAHPRLLDNERLNRLRHEVAVAAEDRRQHRLIAHRLLERERAITAEIEKLAESVRAFHQAACAGTVSAEEMRRAEAAYLETVKSMRTYDGEWFPAIVLELADLLAEWTVPPLGAEAQIDRFLDGVTAGVEAIRAQMREIDERRDGK